ncbi:hypothetical protein QQS21_003681 [Conoideocrella luteorostrata]|uniref:Uncharacterized protein n=1 Tax=Conoideocrella luteorostrata TaxID=1105319 RepID=A0AAJ0CSZ8_9HYPO|nr:hypothetical protein QQS21_003681 [Conoideocrella luteorostrata]
MSVHKWDERSHYGLLLALLEAADPRKEMITMLATHMQAQGFQTTFHGINQHIQKLRRDQGSPEKGASKSAPATPTKATPQKRKARASKAKNAKSEAKVDDGEDDELPSTIKCEEPQEPTPKRAKIAKAESEGTES